MAEIQVGEISYHYELSGDGPALVFIAGFGADHLTWREVYPRLSGRCRILLFDNPASGRTRDAGGELTIEEMADSTAALLDTLGLERPAVIGHSMGGSIALALAARHPGRAARLVIVNSSPAWNRRTLLALEGVISSIKSGIDLDSRLKIIMPWLFGREELADPARAAKLREMLLDEPYPATVSGLERHYRALAAFDGRDLLTRIEVPTLVVSAEDDLLALPEETARLAAGIPGARLVRLPGGHVSQFERPQLLAETIARFCDG